MNYAIIDGSNNVINIVVWDGLTSFVLPTGYTMAPATAALMARYYDYLQTQLVM